MISYGKQSINQEDIDAVVEVMRSDWLTQGPMIDKFESMLCQRFGCKYAVVVSSGTMALHLAYLSLGVAQGEEVVTSPNTFLATANGVVYCGGKPKFVDIDKKTYNISAEQLKKYLSRPRNRKELKGISVVHFAGQPCDMQPIYEIAKEHGLWLLEDASHAPGARWKNGSQEWQIVGSCSHSDCAILSFHPVKHITTGEGGAVLTNRKDVADKVRILRTHGMAKDASDFVNTAGIQNSTPNEQPWYYEMRELGFNARITDFQCALGISQLRRLDDFLTKRRKIAARYDEELKGLKDITLPYVSDNCEHAYHLYVVQSKDRDALFAHLLKNGIAPQVHYIPVHTQPYYQKIFGYKWGDYPLVENYYAHTISIPMYPTLGADEQDNVIETIKRFTKK